MSKIKSFLSDARDFLEAIYFLTVIFASIVAVSTFLYTVISDRNQKNATRFATWQRNAIHSIVNNWEKSTISFQAIKDQYQNRIDREKSTTGITFSRQQSSDDSLKYALQNLIDQGYLRSVGDNQYTILNRTSNPSIEMLQAMTKIRLTDIEMQGKIETILVGNPLEYDINTLYIELAKSEPIDRLDYNRIMGVLMSIRVILVDENGQLFHVTDSVSVYE